MYGSYYLPGLVGQEGPGVMGGGVCPSPRPNLLSKSRKFKIQQKYCQEAGNGVLQSTMF